MRLLETVDGHTFNLTKDYPNDDAVPAYAILSHTWGDQEVTFDDLINDNKNGYSRIRASLRRLRPHSRKVGYDKIRFCAQQAKRDGLRYFWVDTCCIDKRNLTELQRAINSMFRWYRDAKKCYVYLSDVSNADPREGNETSAWLSAFVSSRWFTRGWTLQELLAPAVVEFFSKEGVYLGDRLELQQHIHDITKIPLLALSGASLVEFSIEEKFSWVEGRQTTCQEDKAYSMLGIFGIFLPLIYGEGYEKALQRLQGEIAESQGGAIGPGAKMKRMPLSTVPFKRDSDFVTRDCLDAIRQLCAKPAARAALVGLGGVGKSQIAVEYAYQVQEQSPPPWIFWVHAGTQARFREGYRTIAEAIKMDGWNDQDVNYMRLVRTWLCDESNGRWVMVVDNADDAGVFFHDTTQGPATQSSDASWTEPLVNFLPQRSLGSILITSRSCDVAYRLTGAEASIINVGPMNEEDAFALLQNKFSFPVKKKEVTSLISALDSMPLALTQAAAYINRRRPRMSISQYVKDFRRSDRDRAYLLEKDMGDSRRDGEASNSVIATWQISFEHIRKQTPSAARLLSLMSFFDRQSIPESLLQHRYGGESEKETNFEDDIYTLISFSLIRPSAGGGSFDMHRLVQLSTKLWLKQSSELEYWKEIYLGLINEGFPISGFENWPLCQALFPHVQAALDNLPVDADALETWASISLKASKYAGEMGDYSKAYKLALDGFEVREILLGPEDLLTLDSLNSVGVTLSRLGRYNEAKTMYRRALEVKQRLLGADSVDTLTDKLNLATLYDSQGHWTDAEKLLNQVLEAVSKVEVSADRPLTLLTLTALATTYGRLGRWTDAASLQLQLLTTHMSQLGPGHPTTLTVKHGLAHTYNRQGRFTEAEQLLLEILEAEEMNTGPETELLATKAHLASVYKGQGRWSDAEKIQLQVLDATQRKLGLEHPHTLYSIGDVASTYWIQGRFDEAQELQVQVLPRFVATFGEQHPSTLDAKSNLAQTYWSKNRFAECEALNREVLETRIATLGDEHHSTLDSKAALATTYRTQGRFKDAQELDEFVLRVRSEKLGKDHPHTLGSMGNLACTYHRQGFTERAFELMESCYEAHARVLGPDHPYTGRYKEGLEKWRREGGQDHE
ncbi:ADP binding [Ascochyta rabiei]|uniref:ADP binding n=1 Tax=Didymella rabiei TaxID=5454 RepID=A0A163BHS5_DIDRA|nr:ADP binding [Ascochyta rabiei]